MKSTLRILLVEDSPADAELLLAALEEEDIACDAVRVDTKAEFLGAVSTDTFDLILSDCSLPSFDGFSALKIFRELTALRKLREVPFIFVSGTLGEELAIETLKSGATDYVLKHRLSRLGPAVRRAIVEVEERAARQGAERAYFQAESLFRTIFDEVAVGVAITSLEGQIVKSNSALQAMLGYSDAELSEIPLGKLSYPEDAVADQPSHEELCAGKRRSYELEKRYVRRDGAVLWCRVVVSRIRAERGAPRFCINLIEDFTERKELERRFLQAQKMEVVGRLAAGVSHDFNNLLTVINGYSELLLDRLPQQDPTRHELQEILAAGERATTLTQRLLAFSRQQASHPKVLDLNSIIIGLDHILRRLTTEEIRLTIALDPQAGSIEADQVQIEQIIMNLVINARDAMPEGGELTIATENNRLNGPETDRWGVAAGDYVVLAVTDTGHGMDQATKSRIFEPFFTTKEVGKGTGLGLSMVHDIVQQSRGTVIVDSELKRGTSFRIYLPRVASEAKAASALPKTHVPVQGSETIMVAEDDHAVRDLIQNILEPAGYRLLLARDGAEALAMAQQERDPIHLLITDVAMPIMRGTDLANRLAATRPTLKVLYISGYSGRWIASESLTRRGIAYLQKPFTGDRLRQRVRAILDAPLEACILIVDDDPTIRSLLRDVLQPSGYRVLQASNGSQAVQQLRQEKVDVLVTDLVMPEREGFETIEAAKKEFPDLRILAISGGFGEQFLTVAQLLGAHEILHKPFETDRVLQVVQSLLRDRTNR